jgi:hypothetical protein
MRCKMIADELALVDRSMVQLVWFDNLDVRKDPHLVIGGLGDAACLYALIRRVARGHRRDRCERPSFVQPMTYRVPRVHLRRYKQPALACEADGLSSPGFSPLLRTCIVCALDLQR